MNGTLGRPRGLSPRRHFCPANHCDTCSTREISTADLVFGAVEANRGLMSFDRRQDNLAFCCGGCRQVTDPTGWDRKTVPCWTCRLRAIVRESVNSKPKVYGLADRQKYGSA
jgi:hypothetical protein